MNVKKYVLLASVGLMAVACQDNKLYDNDVKPSGATGDEVQFGASLDKSPTSRTIYGPIADDKKSYPIWWLNGDQVFIASPDCDTPTDSATYIVTAQDGSEYAGSLSRLRNVGVQWGTKNQATFNSIYPCRNYP